MYPDQNNDNFFMTQLTNKKLTVSDGGTVINTVTGKEIGSYNGGFKRIGMRDTESDTIRLIQVHRLLWLAFQPFL